MAAIQRGGKSGLFEEFKVDPSELLTRKKVGEKKGLERMDTRLGRLDVALFPHSSVSLNAESI